MKKLFTKRQIVLLAIPVICNGILYYSARWIAQGFYHYNFTTKLDLAIPFIPSFIFVYWGCYLFWIINYILIVKLSKKGGEQFILAHVIGESICFLFFVFLPTTMVRPSIDGTSLAYQLVSFTYQTDMPNNLLPSIHCFASWLCWIGVRKGKRVSKWYQHMSLLLAILVCISTVTVKQHVIVDVFAGIILAEFSYWLSGFLLRKLNIVA